jgi:hAT family C-terminal dimerisation region
LPGLFRDRFGFSDARFFQIWTLFVIPAAMEAAAAAAAAAVGAAADAAADLIVIDEAEAALPAAAAAGPEAALPAAATGSDPPILWEDDDRLAPYTVVEREGAIYKYYVIVEHPTDNTKLLAFCKLLPIKLAAGSATVSTTGSLTRQATAICGDTCRQRFLTSAHAWNTRRRRLKAEAPSKLSSSSSSQLHVGGALWTAYEKDAFRTSQSPHDDYNLFQWWNSAMSKGAYEHLGQIARVLLGVRPTSVDPERKFSDAGNIITAKRSRLSPAMAEILLMIKSNSDLISDPNEVSVLSRQQVQSMMPQLFGDEDDSVDIADTSGSSDSDDGDSEWVKWPLQGT